MTSKRAISKPVRPQEFQSIVHQLGCAVMIQDEMARIRIYLDVMGSRFGELGIQSIWLLATELPAAEGRVL